MLFDLLRTREHKQETICTLYENSMTFVCNIAIQT